MCVYVKVHAVFVASKPVQNVRVCESACCVGGKQARAKCTCESACCVGGRQALNEAKKQSHTLMERLQTMQNEVSDSEVRCAELEGQIRQLNNVSLS